MIRLPNPFIGSLSRLEGTRIVNEQLPRNEESLTSQILLSIMKYTNSEPQRLWVVCTVRCYPGSKICLLRMCKHPAIAFSNDKVYHFGKQWKTVIRETFVLRMNLCPANFRLNVTWPFAVFQFLTTNVNQIDPRTVLALSTDTVESSDVYPKRFQIIKRHYQMEHCNL